MRFHRRLLRSQPPVTFAILALLAGCFGRTPSAEDARASTIIDAAGAHLTGSALERWLLTAEQLPVHPLASGLISVWIDHALLATALQQGAALDDSTTVNEAIAPDAARGATVEFLAAQTANQPPPTPAQVDSLADAGQVRVLQQILLGIPAGTDSTTVQRIQRRGWELLQRAQAGTDFSTLVTEASRNGLTRPGSGFLPATTRDQLPAELAAAVWPLKEGQVNPQLITSPLGVYVVRRATRAESRAGLQAWLASRLARDASTRFRDSVVLSREVTLGPKAVQRFRALAREPVAVSDNLPMAVWTGDSLSPAEARVWLLMLPPAERAELSGLSKLASTRFIRDLAQREILVALAAPDGALTPRARQALDPAYHRSLDAAKAVLDRYGRALPPGDAATAVLDSLVTQRLPPRYLPGALAGVLRQRYSVAVDWDGVAALLRVSRAEWSKRRDRDSLVVPP